MATSVFPTGTAEPKDLQEYPITLVPTPPLSSSPSQSVFTLPRPRSPATKSHYRPISTLLTPPPSAGFQPGFDAPPAKLRRGITKKSSFIRPKSSIGLPFPTMGFKKSNKDKEKAERPSTAEGPANRFFPLSLKKKQSFNSLAILQTEESANSDGPAVSTTPPALHTPTLEASFAENSTSAFNHTQSSSSSSSSSDNLLSSSSANPSEEKLVAFPSLSVPASDEDEDEDDYEYAYGRPAVDRYRPKDTWHTRRKLRLHPYGDDAPYMQAYDNVALESDRYMHILLRRLNSRGSPTFLDLPSPPLSVLDLGCGQGYWLLDAATHWPNAQIVGFDLVDTLLPEVYERDNIKFVRGNFVRYALPFPPNTFDYIHISNLSLAIPSTKWDFVLSEAYRLLQVGGRLEVIDDDVVFPYGKEPAFQSRSRTSKSESRDRKLSAIDRNTSEFDLSQDQDADADLELQENVETREESFWDDDDDDNHEEVEAEAEADGEIDSLEGEPPLDPQSPPIVSTDLSPPFLDLEIERPSLSDAFSSTSSETADGNDAFLDIAVPVPVPTVALRPTRPLPSTPEIPIRPLPPVPDNAEVADTKVMTLTISDFDGESDTPLTATGLDTATLPTPTPASSNCSPSPVSISVQEPTPTDSVSVVAPTRDSAPQSTLRRFRSEWACSASNAHDLESIFVEMLGTQFDVHPQRGQMIPKYLKKVFGKSNSMKVQSMHLKLAPPVLLDLLPHAQRKPKNGTLFEEDEFGVSKEKKNWMNIEWDRKDKTLKERKGSKKDKDAAAMAIFDSTTRSRANTGPSISEGRSSGESITTSNVIPEGLSVKAAGRLGITYSALAAATRSAQASPASTIVSSVAASSAASIHSNCSSGSSTLASSANTSRPSDDETRRDSSENEADSDDDVMAIREHFAQSPGLLLWPATFIPMGADEVEMHACKHMHMLLACKNAIAEWVAGHQDDGGKAMISEQELEDAMWEYECFRRHRLNWPSETPDTDMESHLQTAHDYSANIEIPGALKSADSTVSSFSTDSASSWASEVPLGPFTSDSIVHVRTLRVYQGIKTRKPTRV